MTHTTLISTTELTKHLDDPDWAIVDCRFLLAEPDKCEEKYLEAHIPGAVYAHLDRDLSDTIIPGETSRHPWPSVQETTELFSTMGIGPGVQVVAYDAEGGGLAATRVWWMLRWLGHEAAAVLDGGWGKWVGEGRATRSNKETRTKRAFIPQLRPELLANTEQVEVIRQDPTYRLIDARAAERYRGEVEPIDPVAGHIPGALNAPWKDNLSEEGVLLPKEELRVYYQALLGDVPTDRTVIYCGSGVTSIHNALAMMVASLGEPRIYAGSWSEWITDPARPVATKSD